MVSGLDALALLIGSMDTGLWTPQIKSYTLDFTILELQLHNCCTISAKQICKSVEGVEKKDLLREDFLLLCQTFHKVLDSDDYMDRLLDFVHLVVQVGATAHEHARTHAHTHIQSTFLHILDRVL